ncbi:hypothetical protein ADUPG1_007613, partial [Aduncisulcus paluster]
RAGIEWTTYAHSGTIIPFTAVGNGAEDFMGYLDNTEIAEIMADQLNVELDHEKSTRESVTELHATVLSTEDSGLIHTGVVPYGPQTVLVQIEDDPWQAQTLEINNHLMGKADIDTPCKAGDKIIIGVKVEDGRIINAKVLEHDRGLWLTAMACLFVVLLIGYAGAIGIKALVSFALSVWII